MTREEKKQEINDLKEMFTSFDNFYVTDYQGLTVEEINDLRMLCHEKNVKYKLRKSLLIGLFFIFKILFVCLKIFFFIS